MKKEIIINSAINEVRVAITEDTQLAEFYIEFPDKERYIGNVYLGKVNKVVTGINAAFIDIGMEQDAFLHFSDVDESLENTFYTDEDDVDDSDENIDDDFIEEKNPQKANIKKYMNETAAVALRKEQFTPGDANKLATFKTKRSGEVLINLESKQDVLVQVIREAYGNKGMKVTTKIAIPGRYTVLLPFDDMIGVSKKTPTALERRRLRQLARNVLPNGYGCIIRTAAQGKSEDELRRDLRHLVNIWKEIEQKVEKAKKPMLVYQDLGLATSVIRDLFQSDVERVVVDSKKLYKEIVAYLKSVSPHLVDKVEYYAGQSSIFEVYGIEKELAKTYRRSVALPGGGDIVIDRTEAMTVVDVNSGRSNDNEQEKNAMKTNLEACREIARQIRLRDIAGIIICDFIDMTTESNRKKLLHEMRRELSRDRAKTVTYPLTQLGLLQITRQRINQNIEEKTSEECPMCNGTGRVTSRAVLLNSIERWLRNFRKKSREFKLVLQLHPHVASHITEGTISTISKLMLKYFVKITVQQNDTVPIDKFRFLSVRRQKDITYEFIN